MKRFYLPLYILAATSLVGCLLFSCKKLVEVPPPEDRISRGAVFANDATAQSAVTGLYTEMLKTNGQLTSIGMTLFAGLSADELYNTAALPDYTEFTQNALSPSNSLIRANLWSHTYQLIFHANSILEGLEGASAVSPVLKSRLAGEALLVRAFCHFYLAGLFGDIPYVVTTDYRASAQQGRLPVAQVYQQVVSDLQAAQGRLPAAYPTAGRVRPNLYTATALLARVQLYRQDWAAAEAAATSVINAGLYQLADNLNTVFTPGSPEAIWQLLPVGAGVNTWEGNTFIPGSNVVPAYPLTDALLGAFEPGDGRKEAWTRAITLPAGTFYYPYKYKVRTAPPVTENYTVVRLAELYLLRAEARAHQEELPEGWEDLNRIRRRAGLPDLAATDKAALLAAIEQERRLELAFEWGHRWLDLKRTGRAGAVLAPLKGGSWQPTDVLYPLPQAELLLNPVLTQNEGY